MRGAIREVEPACERVCGILRILQTRRCRLLEAVELGGVRSLGCQWLSWTGITIKRRCHDRIRSAKVWVAEARVYELYSDYDARLEIGDGVDRGADAPPEGTAG